jgi:uncharacterized protein
MNGGSMGRTLVVALAIVIAGFLIGGGLVRFRLADRVVTVKGVAEREVKADVGLWPLSFTAADNDLSIAQSKVESDRRATTRFLARFGIDSSSISLHSLNVTDTRANPYGGPTPPNRYVVKMGVIVRTNDVDALRQASQSINELVRHGVVLAAGQEYGSSGPTYLFTRLNDLKPEMLTESNKNALVAAQQFARESKAKVGGIRRASQGIFEILARDRAPGISEESQIEKNLRVVSTVEYMLN